MKDALTRVLLILAILSSGGSMIFPREPMLIVIIVLSLIGTNGNFKKSLIPIFIFILLIMFIAALQPNGLGISFFIRFVNFLAAFLLLNYMVQLSKETFLSNLNTILTVLPFQAIITFLLAKFLPFLFMEIEINGTNYKTVGLLFTFHEMLESDFSFPRPDGFFYEPGVFQFYLNLLLFLSIFVFRKYKLAIVSCIAIFTLQSSTGIVIMIIQFLAFLMYSSEFSRYFKHWLSKTLLILILVPPIFLVTQQNLEKKLTGDSRGSFLARQYDLLSGLNAVYNNPYFGIGFDYKNYKAIAGKMTFGGIGLDELPVTAFDDRETSSNGIIFMLYSIGIPLSLFFLYGMFNQHFLPEKFVIGLILLITLFGEMLVFTPFFLLFIFSGLIPKKSFQTKPLKTSHIS